MIEFVSKRGNKSIILFIHGFTSGNETWQIENRSFPEVLLEDEKISNSFDIAYISYYTKLADFRKIRTGINLFRVLFRQKTSYVATNNGILSLADIVHSCISLNFDTYENIIIIAHSMGGLIAKSCILRNIELYGSAHKIKLFLSLATPHNGSNWANIGKALFDNEQIIDLAPLSDTLDQLNRDWIKNKALLPKTIYFYGKDDLIVQENSAIALGADKLHTVACDDDHFSISKPDRVDKNCFVGVKKHLIEFAKKVSLQNSLEIKKFTDNGQLDNELFALKLIIADVHRVLIKSAKESFYNAEYATRALLAQGVSQDKLESLYVMIKNLYTLAFMDLHNGKIKDSNELVTEIHKKIIEQDDKLLSTTPIHRLINAVQKTGMLHQLANRLDEDIWWAINHSIKDIEEFKRKKEL
ncbi:ABC-three component system protein [Bacillus alveayuensis]|uniref:ABC-three component system protein n=1 Tax=Aeribacillus alveayuensis TaxID=279215 RepID=UPI0005D0EDE6|nr:ABC-three component system protein [Bacillus alveayuensis]